MLRKSGRMVFDLRPENIPGLKVTFEIDDNFFRHIADTERVKKTTQRKRSFRSRKRYLKSRGR